MRITEKVATAADLIKNLSKLPPDALVYFDCPSCGKANSFHHLGIAVMITTRGSEGK